MSRKSITDEAEEAASDDDGDEPADDEREQLTQRMPKDLLDRVDEFADENGIPSRNSAINMLVRQGLRKMGSN